MSDKQKKLTAKQEMFVRHYLENGYNGTQAAISAGYSEHTAKEMAHENLTKPHIAEIINKRKREVAEKADITYEWKVEMLKKAIEGCANGEATKDGHLHPSGLVAAIAELNKMQGHYAPEKTMNKTMLTATDSQEEWDKMAKDYSDELSKFDKGW